MHALSLSADGNVYVYTWGLFARSREVNRAHLRCGMTYNSRGAHTLPLLHAPGN